MPNRMNIVTIKFVGHIKFKLLVTLVPFVYLNILQSLLGNVSAVSVTVVSTVNFLHLAGVMLLIYLSFKIFNFKWSTLLLKRSLFVVVRNYKMSPEFVGFRPVMYISVIRWSNLLYIQPSRDWPFLADYSAHILYSVHKKCQLLKTDRYKQKRKWIEHQSLTAWKLYQKQNR